jgi:GNAT superfamily N-acetyltransferase
MRHRHQPHLPDHGKDQDKAVAMGRIVGDGGWNFSIADVAVLREHQGKGIGHIIMMATLMARIRDGHQRAHLAHMLCYLQVRLREASIRSLGSNIRRDYN